MLAQRSSGGVGSADSSMSTSWRRISIEFPAPTGFGVAHHTGRGDTGAVRVEGA